MKLADNIEKLIRDLNILDVNTSTEMDQRIMHDALKEQEKLKGTKSAETQPNIWRIIMKRPITRIASVAAALVIIASAVIILDYTAKPVWAIEQSIEVMKNYRGIYFFGILSMSWEDFFKDLGVKDSPELPESEGEFEMWAQSNEDLSRSELVKIVCPENIIISAGRLQSYVQLMDGETYDIGGDDFMKIEPWPTSELLKILKEDTLTWTELHGKDAESGRERIFIKCSRPEDNKAWQLEFDAETKLLISLKQWQNSEFKGFPQFDIRKIVYYEKLPDDIFEIELPDSSEIIAVNTPLHDPNYGMSAEGFTEEQACYKILEEFWQAAIDGDYEAVRKLMPYLANKTDKQLDDMLGSNEGLSELVEMGSVRKVKDGYIVPCTLQLKDKKMIVDIVVMFREIDGQSSCIVLRNEGNAQVVE